MSFDESTINQNLGLVDAKFLSESIESLLPPTPLFVTESTMLDEALDLMVENRIGSILVVDEEERLKGIFTERDVLLKVTTAGLDTSKTPISTVMTANPQAEKPSVTIAVALHKMARGGFRHLPIVDEDQRVSGIISVKDIMEKISNELLKGLFAKTFGK